MNKSLLLFIEMQILYEIIFKYKAKSARIPLYPPKKKTKKILVNTTKFKLTVP